MTEAVRAYVIEADLVVTDLDPAAVGAAVTAELRGHWEHDGPCRLPVRPGSCLGSST